MGKRIKKEKPDTVEIRCPKCGIYIMTYDGKSEINPSAKCRICKHIVKYDIEQKEITYTFPSKRTCISGMRFY